MKNKILVIDGQGGKIGCLLIEQIKSKKINCEIFAIGTNTIATTNMIKSGADYGGTGENPIVANCKNANIILGPIGIVIADSFIGEVTPAMAVAVGQSYAKKILLPINKCNSYVVGTNSLPISELINLAVLQIED